MSREEENILFGKFTALECLKKDESGSVWLAHHIYLDQPVILKILLPGRLTDPAGAERFRREAQLLARLSHPNIIRVLDFSVTADAFYISFEYFKGVSLRTRLNGDALTLERKGAIIAQTAAALEAAHSQRIIHRDVKPENILLNDQGQVKLADFGLALPAEGAAVTLKSAVVGTPGYMSPEQIRGEALTPASDLFALGIVACELFYGRHPFLDADVGMTLNNILAGEEAALPEAPLLPQGLPELIAGLLRKNRQERIGLAAEVLHRLAEIFPEAQGIKGLAPDAVPDAQTHLPEIGPEASQTKTRKKTGRGRPRVRLAWAGLLTLAMTAAVLLKNPLPLERFSWQKAEQPSVGAEEREAGSGTLGEQTRAAQTSPASQDDPGSRGEPAGRGTQESPSGAALQREPAGAAAVESRTGTDSDSPGSHLGIKIDPDGARPGLERPGDAAAAADQVPGLLFITCEPWAEVFIDSVRIDATPLQDALRLFPGLHELRLRHPDYPDYRQILRIAPHHSLQVAVNLDTLFGFLELRIHPWAEIWVDGAARGQTPLARPLVLEPGGHRLRLRHPVYGEMEDNITVVKAETTRFTLNMSQLAGRKN